MNDIELFREWQAADRAACAAEKAVLADSLRPIEAMGNSPAVYHIEKARRRRAIANQLFRIAMEAMSPKSALSER